MAVLAGTDGAVNFATGYNIRINGWTFDATSESVDTTSWDDYDSTNDELWRTRIGGIKQWGGTYTALMDETESVITALGGAAATIELELDEDDAANPYISGSVIITNVSAGNAMEGRGEVTFTFEGSGAPTLTDGS